MFNSLPPLYPARLARPFLRFPFSRFSFFSWLLRSDTHGYPRPVQCFVLNYDDLWTPFDDLDGICEVLAARREGDFR